MKPIELRRVVFAGAVLLLAIAGCASPLPGAATTASPSAAVTPTPTSENALTAVAQREADRLMAGLPKGAVKAAAYVTTTSTGYIATLPDTAGIPSAPPGTDVVIVVEIEGWWPANHSCFGPSACADTGILLAYDATTGATLDTAFEDDPWSPDRPLPGPSVSQRFSVLTHWGTPVLLQVPT